MLSDNTFCKVLLLLHDLNQMSLVVSMGIQKVNESEPLNLLTSIIWEIHIRNKYKNKKYNKFSLFSVVISSIYDSSW